ncbi:MAG: hypothetical protein SH857_04880 [Chitinophagales bacterium]|nr:hypothetical protein [Chitinophagales bacterium]
MLSAVKDKLAAFFSHRITLVLSFIVLLPPCLLEQVNVGIDSSWKIALGLANLNGLLFGKDIVFTYGPLHFFITKVGVLHEYKWVIAVFELTTIGFLLHIISKVYQKDTHPLKGLFLFLLCFMLSNFCSDYYIMLIFLFAAYQVLIENKTAYLYCMLFISVITFFIKINFGFINFIALVFTAANHAYANKSKIPTALLLVFSFPVFIFTLSSVLNVDLQGYLRGGINIIDDYNDAMNLPFSTTDIVDWIGISVLGVFAFMILMNLRFFLQKPHLLPALLFLLYYYLLFKMGVVRIDAHIFIFIFNSPMFYLLFYIWNNQLRFIKQCFAITLLLGFFSIPMGVLNYTTFKKDSWINPIEKLNFWGYCIDLLTDNKYKSEFDEKKIEPIKLNEIQLRNISNKTVDILPEDISVIYRHKLNYSPRPLIQSYSAYSLFLDSLNYKKYVSPTAPKFLLLYNKRIDQRVPFWDESVTKRAMLSNYELIETADRYDSSYLLLKEKTIPVRYSVVVIDSFSSETESVIDIPQDSANVYLYLDIQYSRWGKLKRLFFQAPILEIEFIYDDDTRMVYRCLPKIANTGVLINKLVRTNQDAYNFYKGKHGQLRKIVQFKLRPKSGFDSKIQIKFIKLEQDKV